MSRLSATTVGSGVLFAGTKATSPRRAARRSGITRRFPVPLRRAWQRLALRSWKQAASSTLLGTGTPLPPAPSPLPPTHSPPPAPLSPAPPCPRYLTRFIRANKDFKQALKQLLKTAAWRAKVGADEIRRRVREEGMR